MVAGVKLGCLVTDILPLPAAAVAAAAVADTLCMSHLKYIITRIDIANVVTTSHQAYYLGTVNKICVKNYYKVLTSAMRSIWSLVSPKTYQAQPHSFLYSVFNFLGK